MREVAVAPEVRAEPTQEAVPFRSLRWPVLGLCVLAILIGWLPRLFWGFWTDEAGTFWMVCEGWRAAIERSGHWAGQSILYGIIESLFVSKGSWQEPLLRIPSVLAVAFAAWQLKRIAELLMGRDAGWLALAPLVCAPDILVFSTSARPYPLALAASLASFRYLLQWRESEDKWTAAKYLAASVLTLHFHYLFGFVFVIQAAYLVFCWLCGRSVRLWLPLTAAVVLPLSMLPLAGSLSFTAKHSANFAHAVRPTIGQLLQLCFPPALLLATALGGVLLLVSARNLKWRPMRLRPESIFLILSWMMLGPIAFFLAARLTSQSVFASRYLLFALPAFVLLMVWLLSGLNRPESQLLVLVAVLAATVLHPGMLMQVFRESPSSWRAPLRVVANESRGEAPPVFVTSGMVDSGSVNWKEHDPRTSYLFAALTAYPIPNRMIPLPYQFGEDVQEFIRQTISSDETAGRGCFLLAASDSPLGSWMSGYMRQRGFRAEVHAVNDYVVIQFRRERDLP